VQLHIPPETGLKAQICLLTDKISEEPEESIPNTVSDVVVPLVWASKKPGKAKNVTPPESELKPGARLVMVNQYPIRLKACKGLELLIDTFMQYALFRECQSKFNTPVLPVKKPFSEECGLVQDLREINRIAMDIHPPVPNPYTLLASVPETNAYFTGLD